MNGARRLMPAKYHSKQWIGGGDGWRKRQPCECHQRNEHEDDDQVSAFLQHPLVGRAALVDPPTELVRDFPTHVRGLEFRPPGKQVAREVMREEPPDDVD